MILSEVRQMKKYIIFLCVMLNVNAFNEAKAQPESCDAIGTALGYGSICVHPWMPIAGDNFNLNFSSTSCTQLARHQNQVLRNGNVFNIYMAVEVGGCPGVIQAPLPFSTAQVGVPAGEYTANLYRLPVPNWPPPPFDPDDYALHNSVNFTVLGVPDTAEPVPFLSTMVLLLLIGLLSFLGMASLRLPRKT
jgi:hypothetical protein